MNKFEQPGEEKKTPWADEERLGLNNFWVDQDTLDKAEKKENGKMTITMIVGGNRGINHREGDPANLVIPGNKKVAGKILSVGPEIFQDDGQPYANPRHEITFEMESAN